MKYPQTNVRMKNHSFRFHGFFRAGGLELFIVFPYIKTSRPTNKCGADRPTLRTPEDTVLNSPVKNSD